MQSTPLEPLSNIVEMLTSARAPGAGIRVSAIAASMVQLCYYSYDAQTSSIPIDVANASLVFPPQRNTYWRCVWGPVLDEALGNLVYVAGLFLEPPTQPATPFLVVVVTRGTDPDGVWADLQELYEDMTPVPQGNAPWNSNSNEWIANGTLDALSNVQSLRWNGETLLEFLSTLPQVSGVEPLILVAGHSLGGCISTVLAPWLVASLPKAKTKLLTAITFAAPTAGNSAFVSDLLASSPATQSYYNTLDCIPLAWWNLDGIDGIYSPSYPTPYLVEIWVGATNALLWDYPYAQVLNGSAGQLTGTTINLANPIPGVEFMQEVAAQHACANYMLLMGLPVPKAFSPDATWMQRLDPSQAGAEKQVSYP